MVNQPSLKKASGLLRAIAHPVRMEIVKFIAEKGSTNVNKIYNTINLEQTITSQHLRVLRNAELVDTNRDGKFIYYTVNKSKIAQVNVAIIAFFHKKVELDALDTETETIEKKPTKSKAEAS
jgi:ArsR family transcriptional regulator